MIVRLLLVLAVPAVLAAAVCLLPRCWAALCERGRREDAVRPYGPPIEQLAADLRRLLRLHDELSVSAHSALCAHRVWAVEAAIGSRAVEAAAALGVPQPTAPLTRTELSALLSALAAAGLVLPRRVGHFTRDGRL